MSKSLHDYSATTLKTVFRKTFYKDFTADLAKARYEVIIESPFITRSRFNEIFPSIMRLRRKGVSVTVNTEHEGLYIKQAYEAVMVLQEQGVHVLYTAELHRKAAIIGRKVIWEGSLNILSFSDSLEEAFLSVIQLMQDWA